MDRTVREYTRNDFSFVKAGILVFNENGQLLVLRRSEWKKIPGQDYRPDLSHTPDIPGGVIGDNNENESILDGTVRELVEETGIVADPNQLELVYTETNYNDKAQHSKITLIYLLQLNYTPEVKISWEHEYFAWRDVLDVIENHELIGLDDRAIGYVVEHRQVFGV